MNVTWGWSLPEMYRAIHQFRGLSWLYKFAPVANFKKAWERLMHRKISWLSSTQLLWTGIPSVALGAIASAAAQQQCAATDACSPLWFPIRLVIYSAIPFVPIAGTMIAFKAIQKEASRDSMETESLRHREDWLRHWQELTFLSIENNGMHIVRRQFLATFHAKNINPRNFITFDVDSFQFKQE